MTSRRTRFPLALCAGLAVSLAGLSGCDELFPYRSPGEVLFRKRCAECHGIDARTLIAEGVADVLKIDAKDFPPMEALSVLILAVLNGLAVAQELEGEKDAKAEEAYQTFLYLLRLGMKAMESPAQKS